MASLLTQITELTTALGTLGYHELSDALNARPPEMVSVSPEQWKTLDDAFDGGSHEGDFERAYANGLAFFNASDGLRGRRPEIIEWKGGHNNVGDAALPIDLRIDHVFLLSCKYKSKVLHNQSPSNVFEHTLRPAAQTRGGDWFRLVAPLEYQELYESLIDVLALDLPTRADELTSQERAVLKAHLPEKKWPGRSEKHYARLCEVVAEASAKRWREELTTKSEQENTFWRLLRFGQAPYFLLGQVSKHPLRLRIATPWDWRQIYDFTSLSVESRAAGQPTVDWVAHMRSKHSREVIEVKGHVEVRWSHKAFQNVPEAKIYLDSPHSSVPGYFELS